MLTVFAILAAYAIVGVDAVLTFGLGHGIAIMCALLILAPYPPSNNR